MAVHGFPTRNRLCDSRQESKPGDKEELGMLRNTFCHVPGIGPATEVRIWESGTLSWEDCKDSAELPFPTKRRQRVIEHVVLSEKMLMDEDPRFFAGLLPTNQHWRLYPDFRSSVAYLDIETTGLSAWDHSITTIALYDGRDIRYYVQGENLEAFEEDISRYKLIVSFNGKSFDVPFLEWHFRTKLDHVHIDLRHVLKSLGISGGLKRCEYQLGINRGEELLGVDGYFAVLLWREYEQTGDRKLLETLLAYNIEDVVNLESLMVLAYNMKLARLGIPGEALEVPLPPEVPFRPHFETVRRVRRKYLAW